MASARIASARSSSLQLMTHVVVGYPSLDKTFELVMTMVKSGVGMIELQIPFSDPVADGPIILRASQYALDNGTRVEDAFNLVEKIRNAGIDIPLLFMTYANIALSYGIESFVQKSAEIGIDGFIIPDLPIDTKEGELFYEACQKTNTEMIPLYAPTMGQDRFELLGKYSHHLVYAVSRTGITGVAGMGNNLEEYIAKIRLYSSAQIALGFGIQSIQQIQSLSGLVEYAVVGSHLINIFEKNSFAGVQSFLDEFYEERIIKNI